MTGKATLAKPASPLVRHRKRCRGRRLRARQRRRFRLLKLFRRKLRQEIEVESARQAVRLARAGHRRGRS